MRSTIAVSLLLLQCCAAAPASQPASVPLPPPGCLDVQGQRELLAGLELEAGPQAAALARCNVRVTGAEHYAQQQSARADRADARAVWVPVVSSVAAAIAAGLTAWGITKATQPHAAPATVSP